MGGYFWDSLINVNSEVSGGSLLSTGGGRVRVEVLSVCMTFATAVSTVITL